MLCIQSLQLHALSTVELECKKCCARHLITSLISRERSKMYWVSIPSMTSNQSFHLQCLHSVHRNLLTCQYINIMVVITPPISILICKMCYHWNSFPLMSISPSQSVIVVHIKLLPTHFIASQPLSRWYINSHCSVCRWSFASIHCNWNSANMGIQFWD